MQALPDQSRQDLGLSRRTVAYYDGGARLIPKVVRLACKGAEQELRAGSCRAES